jgi:hypothetical protein
MSSMHTFHIDDFCVVFATHHKFSCCLVHSYKRYFMVDVCFVDFRSGAQTIDEMVQLALLFIY